MDGWLKEGGGGGGGVERFVWGGGGEGGMWRVVWWGKEGDRGGGG